MYVTLGYTGFREFAPIVNPINPGLLELPLLFVYTPGARVITNIILRSI